jgi:hypothetical protein
MLLDYGGHIVDVYWNTICEVPHWVLYDETRLIVKDNQRVTTSKGNPNRGILETKDFSDSDAVFAKNAGMTYIDVAFKKFLKQ